MHRSEYNPGEGEDFVTPAKSASRKVGLVYLRPFLTVLQSHFSQAEIYGGDFSGLYPTAIRYEPHFGQRSGLPLSNRIVAARKAVRADCVASKTNAASARPTLLACVSQFARCHADFATTLRCPRT